MKAKHVVHLEKDLETNRVRVMIGVGPDRLVDGFIAEGESQALNDILNSKLEYQEKIDAINQLINDSGTFEEATYEHT